MEKKGRLTVRFVMTTSIFVALVLASIVVSCSETSPVPATPTVNASPTLTYKEIVASAPPYPTRTVTPTPALTSTALARAAATEQVRLYRTRLSPTATAQFPEPTVVTSDGRCLAGIEPLVGEIRQVIDDSRYLAQTFFEAWGSQGRGSWGGGNQELDELVEQALELVLSQVAEVEAKGQDEVWAQAVRELDLEIAGMWRGLSEGQSEPVGRLFNALAEAQGLDLACQFGDFGCSNRQAISRGLAMAKALQDLADAGEGCTGFDPLTVWLRNLADATLELLCQLTTGLGLSIDELPTDLRLGHICDSS